MLRARRQSIRLVACLLLTLAALALGEQNSANARAISARRLGVNVSVVAPNGQYGPSDLSRASSSGLGLARVQLIEGSNADPVVELAARAHLRIFPILGLPQPPILGLPQQLSPLTAAAAMAQYVSAFAHRYGPRGTFWSQNSKLPYLPVQSYEIGNEPNIPLVWVADSTNLHWSDPASYAQVYEAAHAALHRADPRGVAVVGGLADSATDFGAGPVDVQSDEEWLAALTPGTVDAVGYHPYTFDVSPALMRTDTEALRRWMNRHRMRGVPIDVDEMGACDHTPQTTINAGCSPQSISSANWGRFAARFTRWALCTPAMHIGNVQPEYWGDAPATDSDAVLALVTSEGSLTPYGRDFLHEAKRLTTHGCPKGR